MQFFKYLTKNDIGLSSHQAGPVIPLNSIEFFPFLPTKNISTQNPSENATVRTSLYEDGSFVGISISSYQFQTWGGTRDPEYRLTSGLSRLLNNAKVDDLFIASRISEDEYKLELHTENSPNLLELTRTIQEAISDGLTFRTRMPSGLISFGTTTSSEDYNNSQIFTKRTLTELNESTRIYRDRKFRNELKSAYSDRCAISGEGMRVPNTSKSELDGAHIVPVSSDGADTVSNGLLLNKRLHWAFDNGLFYIDSDYTVRVSPQSINFPNNHYLASFDGNQIILPQSAADRPSIEALDWHRTNIASSD